MRSPLATRRPPRPPPVLEHARRRRSAGRQRAGHRARHRHPDGQGRARRGHDRLPGRRAAAVSWSAPGHELWHPAPAFYYQPGGGPLLDMGPYYLTILVSFFGPVVRVSGSATRSSRERTVATGPAGGHPDPGRRRHPRGGRPRTRERGRLDGHRVLRGLGAHAVAVVRGLRHGGHPRHARPERVLGDRRRSPTADDPPPGGTCPSAGRVRRRRSAGTAWPTWRRRESRHLLRHRHSIRKLGKKEDPFQPHPLPEDWHENWR